MPRLKAILSKRWIWLLASLGLIVYSLILMQQAGPPVDHSPVLKLLNEKFDLGIVNIFNFVKAIPFLLAGGLLSALVAPPLWKKQKESPTVSEFHIKPDWAYSLPRAAIALLLLGLLVYILSRHKYTPFLPWLWVYVLVLLTYLFYQSERSTAIMLVQKINRVDILCMIGLLFIGLAIGTFALNDIPVFLIPDEGAFWEAARSIAIGELKPAFFGFGVYTFPVASSIFQAWVMRLAGIDLWGWRFASVLAGTITVIPLYLLAKEWFDQRIAVLASFIMVTSPYYLTFARMGYNNSQAIFPTVLSLYFWSLGYKHASLLCYWLSGLAAGIAFYTYPAAALGSVTIVIVMLLLVCIRRINFRYAFVALIIFFAATVVIGLPRLVYTSSATDTEPLFFKLIETSFINDFYASGYTNSEEPGSKSFTYTVGTSKVFYAPDVYRTLMIRGTVRSLAALVDRHVITEHLLTTNLSGGFLPAMGLTLGLSLSLLTIKQTRSILLLAWFGAGLFFLSIIAAFPPRQTHLVPVIPILSLIASVGFTASLDTLISALPKPWTRLRIAGRTGLFLLLAGSLLIFGAREYFIVMPTRYPPSFEDIVSWIGWRTEEPVTIVYVGDDEDKPHRIAYLVKTSMVPHRYISTTPSGFDWKDITARSIVFYEEQNETISPPPPWFTKATIYFNPDHETIGAAWTNMDLNLELERPFSKGFIKNLGIHTYFFTAFAIIAFALIPMKIHVAAQSMDEDQALHIHAEIIIQKIGEKPEE